MGRVSKKLINKDLFEDLEEQLSFIIISFKSKDETGAFLNEFLTKEEKIMLGKRLTLYMMLYKGMTSKQIHDSLSMSYETIRWYKQIYENKSATFKKEIEKLISREKSKELWDKIEKALKPIDLIIKSRNDMRARAKLGSGDFS